MEFSADQILEIAAWVLLGIGSVFAVIGGIGLLRLPDFYTRMHAAGVTDTVGAGAILIGLMLISGANLITVKLIFILLFIFFTSPTSSHSVAKAAMGAGFKPLLQNRNRQG